MKKMMKQESVKDFFATVFGRWNDEKRSVYIYLSLYLNKIDNDLQAWNEFENLYDYLITKNNILGIKYYDLNKYKETLNELL
jgi:hypothetical protein